MTLISYFFLLLFLPIVYLLFWYVASTNQQKILLLVLASYAFYFLLDPRFVLFAVIMMAATFLCARKNWILVGILINLIPLIIFKFLFSYSAVFGINQFIIPLGVSYYSFKHIGYLVDVWKGRLEASESLLEFSLFSAFFAQIVAGPVNSFSYFSKQISNLPKRLDKAEIYEAMLYLGIGLSKTVLIGQVLFEFLAHETLLINRSSVFWSWGIVIIFTVQLYFDFSGYTDIAIGIGKLFSIHLPGNFNNPWVAITPKEFWNRWHMSVTNWFKIYLFFPLSRKMLKKFGRKHSNIIDYSVTLFNMLLIGMWHNLSLGFVVWGFYNGGLLVLNGWGSNKKIQISPQWMQRILFLVAMLGGFSLLIYSDWESYQNLLFGMLGVYGWGTFSMNPLAIAAFIAGVSIIISEQVEAINIRNTSAISFRIIISIITSLALIAVGRQVISFAYANF